MTRPNALQTSSPYETLPLTSYHTTSSPLSPRVLQRMAICRFSLSSDTAEADLITNLVATARMPITYEYGLHLSNFTVEDVPWQNKLQHLRQPTCHCLDITRKHNPGFLEQYKQELRYEDQRGLLDGQTHHQQESWAERERAEHASVQHSHIYGWSVEISSWHNWYSNNSKTITTPRPEVSAKHNI